MKVYLRYIHKISQNPEADTSGPYTIRGLDLDVTWKWLRKAEGVYKSRAHDGQHREQDGGLVYFVRGIYHSLMVMPVGSDLHKKHAPPSHFEEGGPLHGDEALMSGQSKDSPVHPEALGQMRERGGCWFAYRNEAMDSANHGHLQFLQVGPENTFKDPKELLKQFPFDTRSGLGWRYQLLGMVSLETGMISDG